MGIQCWGHKSHPVLTCGISLYAIYFAATTQYVLHIPIDNTGIYSSLIRFLYYCMIIQITSQLSITVKNEDGEVYHRRH